MTHGYNRDGGPFGVPNPVAAPAPRRSGRGWRIVLTALLASVALCVFGTVAMVLTGDDAQRSVDLAQPTTTSTGADVGKAAGRAATSAPVKAAPAERVTIGAGTWEVGTEVRAGTYVTTGRGTCYWARLSDFEGNGADSIIANGLIRDGARGRFTLKKGDRGVELRGNCVWERQ